MCRCPDGRQGNLCQTGKCYNNPCLGRSVSILRDPSCADVPTEGREICVRPVSVNNPCLGRSVSILRDPLCVDVPTEGKEICVRPVSVNNLCLAVYRYYGILCVSMSGRKARKSVSDR